MTIKKYSKFYFLHYKTNQMMANNFIQNKTSQNSKLLTLLTNRQRARSLGSFKRSEWPGKLNPNFASTIRMHNDSSKKNEIILKRKSLNIHTPQYITELPLVRVAQDGQLFLKPCLSLRSFTNRMILESGNSNRRYTAEKRSRKSSVIKIQQNQSTVMMSRIFKNSKITKQANQIIDKKLIESSQDLKQKISSTRYNKTFVNFPDVLTNNKQNKAQTSRGEDIKTKISLKNSPAKEQVKNKYKIDFMAFGFIQKVMDNPQLWSKYVHKVPLNKDKIKAFQIQTSEHQV